MKSLVIYESPNKFKTFSSMFEGMDVSFCYTQGRIYDLPTNDYGINKKMELTLVPINNERLAFIENKIAQHELIYCLTDNDPEGEWIASHIKEMAKDSKAKFLRVRVNELNKSSLEEGIVQASENLDRGLLSKAIVRRTIDRTIGYYNNKKKEIKRGRVLTPIISDIHNNPTAPKATLILTDESGLQIKIEAPTSSSDALKSELLDMKGEYKGIKSKDNVDLYSTGDLLKERALFHDSKPENVFEEIQHEYEIGNISYARTPNKKYEVLGGEHKGIHALGKKIDIEDEGSFTDTVLDMIKLRTLIHMNPDKFSVSKYEPSNKLYSLCKKHDAEVKQISKVTTIPQSRYEIKRPVLLHARMSSTPRKLTVQVFDHNKSYELLNRFEKLGIGEPSTLHSHAKKIRKLVTLDEVGFRLNSHGVRIAIQSDKLSMRLREPDFTRSMNELLDNNTLSIEIKSKKCLNVLRISDPTGSGLNLGS